MKEVYLDNILDKTYKFIKFRIFTSNAFIYSAIFALILANSPYSTIYFKFIHFDLGFKLGTLEFSNSLIHWVNDALMAIFFLYVGLEIKREFFIGELAQLEKALLPIFAAIGGMIIPAILYFIVNIKSGYLKGTGIPIATDIAFSLGILSLVRKNFPLSLKIFLTAFAIIDDIGAVLVIAIFYTSKLNLIYLIFATVVFSIMILFNRMKIIHPIPYTLAGILLWLLIYSSGIHATIAGLLCAITVPVQGKVDIHFFSAALNVLSKEVDKKKKKILDLDALSVGKLITPEVQSIELTSKFFTPPLLKLENLLQPWINYVILPFFAFVNSGINFSNIEMINIFYNPIFIGIVLGLVLGKPAGILLFSFFAIKYKICSLPRGTTWKMLFGVSILGGIGFTMSLFIGTLSFQNDYLLDISKLGIFFATLFSSLLGFLFLKNLKN